jgi:membrane associated rhomboid family serine protease
MKMEQKHIEEGTSEVNVKGLIILIGTVFGALIGGLTQESFVAAIVGLIVGLIFAAFFATVLLKDTPHDR